MTDSTVTTLNDGDYYDYHDIMTFNVAWSWIIGARGLGKTFGAKKYVIKDYIKNGNQFIYLRRTDVEQKSKGTFFADIADEFPRWTFRVNGNQAEGKPMGADDKTWFILGYFVALSQAGGKKSIPYPDVRTIIYDEVFPDNQVFLSGEVTAFEEFYNTVDRWKDKVRVFFLSNAVIKANPYFAKFNINLDEQQNNKQQIKTYCGGFIAVNLADYGGFSAKVAKSRLGRFLFQYDEDYADYAINNKFRDDSDTLITALDSNIDGYSYTLDTGDYGTFGVWFHMENNFSGFLISRRIKKNFEIQYTLDYRHVSEQMVYIKRNDRITQRLTNDYRLGKIRFDDSQIRADFSQVIGTLLGK